MADNIYWNNPDQRIWEERKYKDGGHPPIENLMTPEQIKRGQYYATQYLIRRGEVDKYKKEWDKLQKIYACERDPDPTDPSMPNSFIPLMTPVVEGQIASMMESDIDFSHITNNPAHEEFMRDLDEASEYIRRKNHFDRHFKDFARLYDLLGNAWITISWEKGYKTKRGVPTGFPKLTIPPVLNVMVDGKIKDYKDLQYADYIIHEIGFQSIAWARDEFGDDKANALTLAYTRYDGENPDISLEDRYTFKLLHVWTRDNPQGNLQLIEMDVNGLILRESDPSKPFYANVDNEYPFAFARMIPQQGRFYGYGDGKILKNMQETVNRLTDELELAARFSAQQKIFVDPDARMDLSQLNSDPSKPIMAKNPNGNIRFSQGTGINGVVVNMIEFLLREAQRSTRFSDVMTGQSIAASSTATSVNAQMMQGAVGIKDKKSDLAQVMAWVDMYCLKMALEYWDKPFWSSLVSDNSRFVDMQAMRNVPAAIPPTTETLEEFYKNAGTENIKEPRFEILYDDYGIKTTDFDFSTKVVIGQSIARGKMDMYNMILGLMQVQVMSNNGTVKPLITAKRAKQLMEETLGFKLETDDDEIDEGMAMNASMLNPMGANMQSPMGMQQPFQMPPENVASTVAGVGGMDKRGQI